MIDFSEGADHLDREGANVCLQMEWPGRADEMIRICAPFKNWCDPAIQRVSVRPVDVSKYRGTIAALHMSAHGTSRLFGAKHQFGRYRRHSGRATTYSDVLV